MIFDSLTLDTLHVRITQTRPDHSPISEIRAAVRHLSTGCKLPYYPTESHPESDRPRWSSAAIFRIVCGNFPKPVVRKILSLASDFSSSIIIGCNSLNNAAALQIQIKMADFQLNFVHRSYSIPQAKLKQVDESSYLYIRALRTLQQPQFYPPKKIFPNFLLSFYEYLRLWKYCFLHQVLVITLTNEGLKVLKLFLNKILIADCVWA